MSCYRPGGAIIAALYLHEFVKPIASAETDDSSTSGKKSPTWFHIDFMGLQSGRAEPQGMRAVLEYLRRRFNA